MLANWNSSLWSLKLINCDYTLDSSYFQIKRANVKSINPPTVAGPRSGTSRNDSDDFQLNSSHQVRLSILTFVELTKRRRYLIRMQSDKGDSRFWGKAYYSAVNLGECDTSLALHSKSYMHVSEFDSFEASIVSCAILCYTVVFKVAILLLVNANPPFYFNSLGKLLNV